MKKMNRRVERTHELLQKALIELVAERSYDAITIQDIVDRAKIGRTTFYQYYNSKDELFLSCHEVITRELDLGPHDPLSREELLSSEMPTMMTAAYQHLEERRAQLYPIFQGRNSQLILRQIRERNAQEIEANLHAVFPETDGAIPLDLLANYLAGAQIALMQWWLEKRRLHSTEALALTLHRMQRAAIREALGIRDIEKKTER